jgi:hypothetical protein
MHLLFAEAYTIRERNNDLRLSQHLVLNLCDFLWER